MTDPDPTADALARLAADAGRVAAERRRTPGATYRFQFHNGFTLPDALRLVPYLHALGVTHAYASPILKARSGSLHGYDVVDHGLLNPEVGTEDALAALAAALRDRGMGLILDAVPNHMCVGADNPWWADVLEHGPSSPHAEWFDIAWYDSPRPGMSGRLLLPVLGDQYGAVLEGGQFRPAFERRPVAEPGVPEQAEFAVHYYENRFPVDPRTYGKVLAPAVADLLDRLGVEHPATIELTSVLNAVEHLPPRGEPDGQKVAMGRVEVASIKRRLADLADRFPDAHAAVVAAVGRLAGTPGDPASFAALDDLLEAQAYRPCFWRVASDEINYRRFFDVNELAAIATERDDVFRAVHRKLFGWLAAGRADGLRIDHPDGLFDPKGYLDRLQAHYLLAVARKLHDDKPDDYPGVEFPRDEAGLLAAISQTPPPNPLPQGERGDQTGPALSPPPFLGEGAGGTGPSPQPLYVVVEKILGDGETLPADWACDGTTGYEFITAVNNLFVDPAGEGRLTRLYHDFAGQPGPFGQAAYEKKYQVLSSSLASELTALAHQLDRLARVDRRTRDFTLNGIRRALREVIAAFPVYRSYVNGGVHDRDKMHVGRAASKARRRNPTVGRAVFDFIRDTVLLRDSPSGPAADEYRAMQRRFAGKFQQLTAPVTAKGVEDTAFYVYNRFVSLNEVGGEPGHFGWPADKVHRFFADRQATYPGGLSPLSTHDTKRSEDVRARLNVLSELPGEWADRVGRWAKLNEGHKAGQEDAAPAPDPNEEYLIYQTLVGVWPDGDAAPSDEFGGRVHGFVRKALREAKVHSSWINPDEGYEAGVAGFVDAALDPARSADFLADLRAFVGRVAFFGRVNSLAQTVIRCTAPGVPDTYQGTEGWDFSLVDPDNRRPVDYESRQGWLKELDDRAGNGLGRLAESLAGNLADPKAKVFAVSRALRLRRDHPDLFARGEYLPLAAEGPQAGHVFAFARRLGGAAAVVIVPRLSAGLVPDGGRPPVGPGVWADTVVRLPDGLGGRWTNAYTGEAVTAGEALPVAEALGVFPAAVLVKESRLAR
ncbi:MAG: malto-oligosyltrehalose synthase [Gemmataceae bacterium]|nr:malto-oligosyltrehalose synthase [Gemmataceae bacterium]